MLRQKLQTALAEMAAGEVGHGVPRQPGAGPPDLVDADDVRVLEPGDGARLVLEAAAADLVGQRLGQHHLDRDFALQRLLLAQVHGRHAAVAEHARQPVAGNLRQDLVLFAVEWRGGHGVADGSQARPILNAAAPQRLMHVKPAIEGAGTLTCIMNTVSSVPPPALTEELLTRLDIPRPRYPSYPPSDRLVEAGVKIVFNYSERLLAVPPEVTVHTSSPAVDLLYALYFHLT